MRQRLVQRRLVRAAATTVTVVLAACGRIGFAPLEEDDAAVAIDAALPFSPPSPLAEVDTAGFEDDPSLTADLLEIYFNAGPSASGIGDVWRAVRTDPSAPFGPPEVVMELSTPDDDEAPDVSPDGLTIFVTSALASGAGGFDLYVATRPDRASPWEPPVLITEIATTANEGSACASADLLTLYFTSDRGGSNAIYVATRARTTDAWSGITLLDDVDDPGGPESSPYLDASLTTLLFTKGVDVAADLAEAVRPALGSPFGPTRVLTELNSAEGDEDPWLSESGDLIVYTSKRDGRTKIWFATRSP